MAGMVRTVVCGYTLGELPTPWLMVYHRFEAAFERAGLDVRVKLAPLEDLPDDPFEVLVVPPELAQQAEALGTGMLMVVTSPADALATIDGLLDKLAEGSELYAASLDPNAPRIERYRGSLPL